LLLCFYACLLCFSSPLFYCFPLLLCLQFLHATLKRAALICATLITCALKHVALITLLEW
jgi:hypothetical protein